MGHNDSIMNNRPGYCRYHYHFIKQRRFVFILHWRPQGWNKPIFLKNFKKILDFKGL